MTDSVFFLLILIITIGPEASDQYKQPVYSSENLEIKALTSNTYIHVSYLKTEKWGKVGCNGAIYVNRGEAVVFDTPVDDVASEELIRWIKKVLNTKVKAVVVTHYHIDCLGGLKEFHDNGISSYASSSTIQLAEKNGYTLPQIGFEGRNELQIGAGTVINWFPGEGHTLHNIVGYIPEDSVLFGGCLVKSLKAGTGNLTDANTKAWPGTIQNIKKQFPGLKWVIPGHGKHGGIELLDYTAMLFVEEK